MTQHFTRGASSGFMAAASLVLALAVSVPSHLQAQGAGLSAASLSEWNISALSPGEKPLPPSLWNGLTDPDVITLIETARLETGSRIGQVLVRSAVLSPANAPTGGARPSALRRLRAGLMLGALPGLQDAIGRLPGTNSDIQAFQLALDAELATGRYDNACGRVKNAPTDPSLTISVLGLRAVCAARAGNVAEATLTLELARAAGPVNPLLAAAVAAKVGQSTAPAPKAKFASLLEASVSGMLALKADPGSVAAAPLPVAVGLALNPQAPIGWRLEAADRAANAGAISPDEQRAVYVAAEGQTIVLTPGIVGYRAIMAATDPAIRLAALAGRLKQAKSGAELAAISRLYRAELEAMQSHPLVRPYLPVFATQALAMGDGRFAFAVSTNIEDPFDRAGAQLTACVLEPSLCDLTTAFRARRDAAGADVARKRIVGRELVLLTGLGLNIDRPTFADLSGLLQPGKVRLNVAGLARARVAADQRLFGEVVLASAMALGRESLGKLDVSDVASLAASLKTAGGEDEARALIAEALWSARADL